MELGLGCLVGKSFMADPTNFEEMNSFPPVWRALGRLYDSTLETREAADRLLSAVEKLSVAVEAQRQMIEFHERRLDRNEITVEAILEDLRRHREGRSPQ